MAFAGQTPKSWNTRYNNLEMGAQVSADVLKKTADRGMAQLDDQFLLRASSTLSTQRNGGDWRSTDTRGAIGGFLGSSRRTPDSFSQTGQIGEESRASIQNAQDLQAGQDLAERFSGGTRTADQRRRFDKMSESADALAYANPGMSLTKSLSITSNFLKPSTLLTMKLAGLPDPRDSSGAYKGNTAFYRAFLKRIYQNRESVPENVFNDDFMEQGVGWANLVAIVGEDGADAMLEPLRAYNRAKSQGKDVSDFDQKSANANKAGSRYDKDRVDMADKYLLGNPEDPSQKAARANVKSLASTMVGNESYVKAQNAATDAMNIFAERVQDFVNSPFISDIANWWKGFAPGLQKSIDAGGSGLMSLNGATGMSGQGPGGSGGSAYGGVPAVAAAGPIGPKPKNKKSGDDDDIASSVAQKATSYATGSRKYKYDMKKRMKDGYFDCSSFVSRVYAQFGYKIGPTTNQMWKQGQHVDFDDLQPGDILLHADGKPGAASGGAEHTAMYVGNGKIVGTSSRGKNGNTIQLQPLYGIKNGYWDDARRIIGSAKQGKPKKDSTSKDSGVSIGTTDSTSTKDTGGGLFDKLADGISSAVGAISGAFSTTGTSDIGGLGAPNASAYSQSELSMLSAILSGGGGTAAAVGSDDAVPMEAKGIEQDAGGDPEQATPSTKARAGKPKKDAGTTKTGKPKNTSPAANKALGRAMASAKGWGKQFTALDKLWTRESGWNELAKNPSSGAYGIPQSLPGTKMASAGKDWKTNPATQIKWGLSYIAGRYGSPTKAWAHSQATGWYEDGAWQVPDDQVAVVHKDEMIMPAKQARTIRDALIKENVGGGSSPQQRMSSATGGNVEMHFAAGSVVLSFGQDVSREAGSAAAKGFLKELERKDLYKKISRAGVMSDDYA
jgi:cell wall-associated NlpC family hydrolase